MARATLTAVAALAGVRRRSACNWAGRKDAVRRPRVRWLTLTGHQVPGSGRLVLGPACSGAVSRHGVDRGVGAGSQHHGLAPCPLLLGS